MLRPASGCRSATHSDVILGWLGRPFPASEPAALWTLGLVPYGMHGIGVFVASTIPAAIAANWFHPTRIVLGPGGLP